MNLSTGNSGCLLSHNGETTEWWLDKFVIKCFSKSIFNECSFLFHKHTVEDSRIFLFPLDTNDNEMHVELLERILFCEGYGKRNRPM